MAGHWAECHLRNPGVERQNAEKPRVSFRILIPGFWILLLAAVTPVRNRFCAFCAFCGYVPDVDQTGT